MVWPATARVNLAARAVSDTVPCEANFVPNWWRSFHSPPPPRPHHHLSRSNARRFRPSCGPSVAPRRSSSCPKKWGSTAVRCSLSWKRSPEVCAHSRASGRLLQGGAEQRASARVGVARGGLQAALPARVTAPRPAPGDRPRACPPPRRRARGRGDDPQARAPQVKLTVANLLLYAVDESSPHHAVAKPWLEREAH